VDSRVSVRQDLRRGRGVAWNAQWRERRGERTGQLNEVLVRIDMTQPFVLLTSR